jgi:hypothetical protein
MHIVIMSNGFYFSGKVRDFRRLLSDLASSPAKVKDFVNNKLN